MNTIRPARFAASVALLSILPAARAVTPGTSATATINFTATTESGGFKVVDPETKAVSYESEKVTEKTDADDNLVSSVTEEKVVFTTYRYGNAQILAELNNAGMLDGTIKNWSIINVKTEGSEGGLALYAVKKGRAPVAISVSATEIADATAFTSKSSTRYIADDEITTYSESGSYKNVSSISFGGFSLRGLFTGGYKYNLAKFGRGEDAVNAELYPGTGVKSTNLAGTYGEGAVAEGTFTLSADKIVDLETLGFGL